MEFGTILVALLALLVGVALGYFVYRARMTTTLRDLRN